MCEVQQSESAAIVMMKGERVRRRKVTASSEVSETRLILKEVKNNSAL